MALDRTEVPDSEKRAGAVLSRQWREARDRKQGEVAAAFGVRQSTLCDWEASLKEPSLKLAFKYEAFTEGAVPARSWAFLWKAWRRALKKAGAPPAPPASPGRTGTDGT